MIRHVAILLALVAVAFGQTAPAITNVTNAAIPALDFPAASIHLAPRSMATIFGTNLADTTLSASTWSTAIGGTEVHLAADTCFDASCDLIAKLIYVSPTQINLLVPENTATANAVPLPYRIVLVRDGQRIDNRQYLLNGPGRVFIDAFYIADYNVVYQMGYDCLFSYSLSDPSSCGLSWSQGQHRAPLGAITDAASGQLISSQNPVHQGQAVTLWFTGLYNGATLNNGLLTANTNPSIGFGVAAFGKDITVNSGVNLSSNTFQGPLPLWTGESPEFVGLDQSNLIFPACMWVPLATTETRYDAYLTYTGQTGTKVRLYVPFIVRPGDFDCSYFPNGMSGVGDPHTYSGLALSSSANTAVAGQAVTLTATVPYFDATGTVTFVDATSVPVIAVGSATMNPPPCKQCGGATATFSTSGLGVGSHTIVGTYHGDQNYGGNTSSVSVTITPAPLVLSISYSPSAPVLGQVITFTVALNNANRTPLYTHWREIPMQNNDICLPR